MGWCWWFCEFIFLNRNWETDKKIIGDALDAIVDHDYPNLIFVACEGTRMTKEKVSKTSYLKISSILITILSWF